MPVPDPDITVAGGEPGNPRYCIHRNPSTVTQDLYSGLLDIELTRPVTMQVPFPRISAEMCMLVSRRKVGIHAFLAMMFPLFFWDSSAAPTTSVRCNIILTQIP